MRKIIASNRNAKKNYQILETVESGIQLNGAEVKSLRAGRANLKNSFAKIENSQVYIYNLHISPYEYSTQEELEPKRIRKLLLHKKQIYYLNKIYRKERLYNYYAILYI